MCARSAMRFACLTCWRGAHAGAGIGFHLNAQLIDTRTDTHVWAEQYDRDLNDLFAVQSEIAQKVAEHLHAKLSASEKASIEERPTQDLVAYEFYARAVSMIYNVQVPGRLTLRRRVFPRLWTCLIRQLLVILTSFSPIASWPLRTIWFTRTRSITLPLVWLWHNRP